MEDWMKPISDILEMILNFLVIMCMETAADAAFGGFQASKEAPLYVLILPVFAPLIFYGTRRLVKKLIFFLAIHIVIIAALFYLAGLFPAALLWKITYLIVGILYAIHSARVRLTREGFDEGEIGPLFAGITAAVTFLFCSYVGRDICCARILWLALLWMPGYWIKDYLDNFLSYVKLNRRAAGAMPEKKILRGGMTMVGIYGGFSLILLAVCSQTPFVFWLSDMVRKAGYGLLRLFFGFLSKFAREPEGMTAVPENGGDRLQMMLEESIEEPSRFAQVLEQILVMIVTLLLIAGAVFLLVQAVRFIIRSFYGRKKEKRETKEEGFVEEEERLKEPERKQNGRLPIIGGTPAQRVRKIFKRTVLELSGEKETDCFAAKTARELAALCTEQNTAEWMALAALYERARYTQQTITRQEVKEAGKLSRQIMHTIK